MTEYRYEVRTVDEEKVEKQILECLPLIELERAAYIRAEMGRLLSCMGTEYIDPDTGDVKLFHAVDETNNDFTLEGEKVADPWELTLEELVEMPKWNKRIERLGTYSYMTFFHIFPEDEKRLKLLASMWRKLMHHYPCLDSEVKQLKEGHDSYIRFKTDDGPVVIR